MVIDHHGEVQAQRKSCHFLTWARLWRMKLCAVGMCNAILGNDLNTYFHQNPGVWLVLWLACLSRVLTPTSLYCILENTILIITILTFHVHQGTSRKIFQGPKEIKIKASQGMVILFVTSCYSWRGLKQICLPEKIS